MKKSILFILGFILICSLCIHAQEQSREEKEAKEKELLLKQQTPSFNSVNNSIKELIIGARNVSEKTYPLIIDAIGNVKGVEFYMFCPVHNLFLIRYDLNKFTSDKDILIKINSQIENIPLYIKDGQFINVLEMCNVEETN